MRIIVFEDEFYSRFYPLTMIRAVYELRFGYNSIIERISRFFNQNIILHVRSYLHDILKIKYPLLKINFLDDSEALLINGRLIPSINNLNLIKSNIGNGQFAIIDSNNSIIAAKLKGELLERVCNFGFPIPINAIMDIHSKCNIIKINGKTLLDNIWDLIILNDEFLKLDFKSHGVKGELDDRVLVYGSMDNLYIGENSRIEGNVNIDIRKGPIHICSNVEIQGPCRIEGPVYIGNETLILSGARIRSGSNIGFKCRVGGEIESSILHGYVNMYHPSFIGHSYVGEWVNLGAFTVTSDLKNTYGTIKVKVNDSIVDTGLNKIGSFIGDHVKTSINCGIFSGKCIGIFSHLIGYVYEDVPSFTIYAKSILGKSYELKLESAIETMRRAYSRRGRNVLQEEVELVKCLFKLSEYERIKTGVIKGPLSFT